MASITPTITARIFSETDESYLEHYNVPMPNTMAAAHSPCAWFCPPAAFGSEEGVGETEFVLLVLVGSAGAMKHTAFYKWSLYTTQDCPRRLLLEVYPISRSKLFMPKNKGA